jgi:SNF2 family DNA or RNA helicase
MTRIEFENRYCVVEERRLGMRKVRVIKGSKNIPELRTRLNGFIIRKTKKECLPELPDISFVTVPLEIKDMSAIDASRPYEFETDDDVFLSLMQGDEHIMRQLVSIGCAKAVAASYYLHDFLVDDHHRKIIVWFTNTAPLDYCQKHLAKFHPVRIDGRDSQTAREFAVHKFLNDPRCQVFLGNIKAAGEGITLLSEFVQPTDVFFVQNDFSPGRNAQAAARCHRIGQRNGVLVRNFIADGVWLDKRIQEIITRKENELAELI